MPPEVLDALGPWGQLGLLITTVGLVVTGFARGWLFTSRSVEWQNKHLEARLLDKDEIIKELKMANAALTKTTETQAKAIYEFVEVGRASNAALTALPRAEVGA